MFRGILPKTALETATAIRLANGVIGELEFWEEMNSCLPAPDHRGGGQRTDPGPGGRISWPNGCPIPLTPGLTIFRPSPKIRQKTLMVGRLDGPTPEIARRLVDDALTVEERACTGSFISMPGALKARTTNRELRLVRPPPAPALRPGEGALDPEGGPG